MPSYLNGMYIISSVAWINPVENEAIFGSTVASGADGCQYYFAYYFEHTSQHIPK
jgi:hypothetical protein